MAASTSTASSSGGGQRWMNKVLLEAATTDNFSLMEDLVSQNPKILLETTPAGNTCLHISSIHGYERFSRNVVAHQLQKSLIRAVNLDKETPLIAAVRNGYVSLATFLLQRCHELGLRQAILQQDSCGFNALHHAIRNGHKNLALQIITTEPALSEAVSNCNDSPMFFAVTRNFTQIYEKLVQNPDCAYSGGLHGYNCLHGAVTTGDQETAKIILEKRPELAREADSVSCTPVRLAIHDGKINMIRVILEQDSTVGYEINSYGDALLTDAATRGQVGAAREILKHCPDAPYHIKNGQTLLHLAVLFEQEVFVEFVLKTPLLLKAVNMQDNNGKTALHFAVQKCNTRIIAALLSHEDIDATILDNSGTPAAWELWKLIQNAKTLNWNEVIMLMSKAYPQGALSLRTLQMQAKQYATSASRKAAKSLTQTYTSNTSLVAILIATITFAAAFTLPGGYSNDPGSEGLPIMSKKFAFQAFLISDVLAMCSSFAVAFICIMARWEDYEFLLYYRSFTKKLMWFAYVATTTAFSTGLYMVLAPCLHWLAIAICVMVAVLPILTMLLGEWPVLKLRFRLGKTFNSDLLSMV